MGLRSTLSAQCKLANFANLLHFGLYFIVIIIVIIIESVSHHSILQSARE